MKQIKHLLVLVALLLPLFAQAADKEVLARLQALPGVSDVQELKSTAYDNKYLLNITQEACILYTPDAADESNGVSNR